jgi:hypothetical protein
MTAVLAAGALAPAACGDEDIDDSAALESEWFVATYVDLRMATLRAGVDQLPVPIRDSILSAHEVTEEDLFQFAELHGRDAGFMQAVWDSVENRMNRLRAPVLDSVAASSADSIRS